MTEDKAKTKWCPMTAGIDPAGRSEMYDRYPDDHVFAVSQRCIASGCMWWVEGDWLIEPIEGQPGHFLHSPQGHCGAIK